MRSDPVATPDDRMWTGQEDRGWQPTHTEMDGGRLARMRLTGMVGEEQEEHLAATNAPRHPT